MLSVSIKNWAYDVSRDCIVSYNNRIEFESETQFGYIKKL